MAATTKPAALTWEVSQSKDNPAMSFTYRDCRTDDGYTLSVATRNHDGRAWWTVKSQPDKWTGIMKYGNGDESTTAEATAAAVAFYRQVSAR